jgi:AraC family transcriptional regulator
MSASRVTLNIVPNISRETRVIPFGRTADGLMVQLRSDPAGVLDLPGFPSVLVAIHVGPASRISCRRGDESHTGSAVHGDIDIVPAGTPARWEMHDANDTALILSLPTPLLDAVTQEYGHDSRRVEIRNRFQVRDPQLESIGWALKTEMEAEYPSGRLYTDSLAVSAASRLVTFHSSVARPETKTNAALNGRRLKQTLSYIEDHLAGDSEVLSLSRIAAIAGLSTSHFNALFRASVGLSLHQYVIQRRVEQAKTLLRRGKLSVTEVALATGFSHQSHLARHMRRVAGLAPGDLRRFAVLSSKK